MNPENKTPWQKIQQALKDKSPYALKIAIIEANRVFLDLLKEKGIKADDTQDAYSKIKKYLSAPGQTLETIKTYKKIIQGQKVSLDYNQTKKYITAYYQALLDVKDENSLKFTVVNKGFKEFTRILKLLIKKIQYFVIGFFGFLVLVVILSETTPGQALAQGVVDLAKFLLFSFLPALFIIAAVVILIAGSVIYYTKRNKPMEGKFVIEEEDEE